MTFRVGQKVVCVNVDEVTHRTTTAKKVRDEIKVGCVYTIRWVGTSPHPLDGHFGPHVRLAEIVRDDHPTHPKYSDMPFIASRFRPVVERKTDISVFTEILRKATKPAPALVQSQHHRGTENG